MNEKMNHESGNDVSKIRIILIIKNMLACICEKIQVFHKWFWSGTGVGYNSDDPMIENMHYHTLKDTPMFTK